MTDHAWIRRRDGRKGSAWQVRYREMVNAKPIMRSKTFATHDEALQFLKTVQARLEVVKVTRGIMADITQPKGKLIQVLETFISEARLGERLKADSKSPDKLKYHIARMMKMFSWEWTTDITADAMRKVLEKFSRKPTMRFAINRALLRFVKWCQKREYKIDKEALEVKSGKPPEAERIFWSEDLAAKIYLELSRDASEITMGRTYKYKAMEDSARETVAKTYASMLPLYRIMLLWGLRPIEVTRLKVKDWDSSERLLNITSRNAKNGRQRTIAIDHETAAMLDNLCSDRGPNEVIFRTQIGKPYQSDYITHAFHKLLERLKIRGSSYCSRHFAATRLLKKTRDINASRHITGHQTLSEFRKYLHVTSEEVRKIADSSYADFLNEPQQQARAAQSAASGSSGQTSPKRDTVDDDADGEAGILAVSDS
jgi:integrase